MNAEDSTSEVNNAVLPGCQSPADGVNNCGATAESCCTSLIVEGGRFFRGYQTTADAGGPRMNAARVSSFRLDKYAVTVGRFRQFVTAWNSGTAFVPSPGAGKHTHLNGGLGLATPAADGGQAFEEGWLASDDGKIVLPASGSQYPYDTWTSGPSGQENLPVNVANWYTAVAFCIWDGGFIPSDAEFEYAAAGGAQQREYPWGETAPGVANKYAIYGDGSAGCYFPTTEQCTGVENIAPVGTAELGAGRWGQLDLTGNWAQWVLDSYDGGYFVMPCDDCAYLVSSNLKVVRGAASGDPVADLESGMRHYSDTTANVGFAFRCARAP